MVFSFSAQLKKAREHSQSDLPKVHLSESYEPVQKVVSSTHDFTVTETNNRISQWLFVSCSVVATIVVVGGMTRLTESGLSIVDWKPIKGIIPPLSEEEWIAEFERYKTFPEYLQKGAMSMDEFKFIFFWEWFHRVLARSMGLVFGLPLLYFCAKGVFSKGAQLPGGHHVSARGLQAKLFAILGLGCLQGAVGWWMVCSGLDHSLMETKQKATVSGYRLSTHLCIAVTIYASMLRIGFGLRYPAMPIPCMPMQLAIRATTLSMFATILTGACTAALDAGLLYCNTFPMMGASLLPPIEDLLVFQPAYRNLFENGSAAQTLHRLLALNTAWFVIAMNLIARRPNVRPQLSPAMLHAIRWVNIAVAAQVALGITTLISHVHIPLAVLHQGNSLVVLGALIRLSAMVGSRGMML